MCIDIDTDNYKIPKLSGQVVDYSFVQNIYKLYYTPRVYSHIIIEPPLYVHDIKLKKRVKLNENLRRNLLVAIQNILYDAYTIYKSAFEPNSVSSTIYEKNLQERLQSSYVHEVLKLMKFHNIDDFKVIRNEILMSIIIDCTSSNILYMLMTYISTLCPNSLISISFQYNHRRTQMKIINQKNLFTKYEWTHLEKYEIPVELSEKVKEMYSIK